MNSKNLGNIGEACVLAELIKMGICVYQQFGDNERADYIIDVNEKLYRIQVKASTTYDGETVTFDLMTSTTHRKNGYKHKYTKKEVDFFLCYDIKTKLVFMIDNTGDLSSAKIRYKKPKNNQTKNIRYYEDYLLTEDKIFNLVL